MLSVGKIPQLELKEKLDNHRSMAETKKSVVELKIGKSLGVDDIPAELHKHGWIAVLKRLHDLFATCREQGTLPENLNDSVIDSLYKNNGHKSDC